MGNASGSLTAGKSKSVLATKLENADKTGVLNLADHDFKPTAMVWGQLTDPIKIQKIRSLDISNNAQLKTIPLEIHGLVNLKSLNATKCSIQRIHNLEMLSRLVMLRLDKNDLEESTLGSLPLSITQLSVRDNHLRFLPPPLLVLNRISFLDLSGNRLENIEGIEALISLQELLLDDNHLCEIPPTIGLLVRLQHLSLKNNQIRSHSLLLSGQSIPRELFVSTSLERLDLAGNPLRQKEILEFEGLEIFLSRRKAGKDKLIQGGGMIDSSLFGLT